MRSRSRFGETGWVYAQPIVYIIHILGISMLYMYVFRLMIAHRRGSTFCSARDIVSNLLPDRTLNFGLFWGFSLKAESDYGGAVMIYILGLFENRFK